MKKNKEWAFIELGKLFPSHAEMHDYPDNITVMKCELLNKVYDILGQLDEPEVLSQDWIDEHKVARINNLRKMTTNDVVPVDDLQTLLVPKQEEVDRAYRKGFKEGERQMAEYFENITEEPSQEQVQKYLSEHGIEVVEKEPETVGSVLDDFYRSIERMKKVLNMEVEEMEE